MKLALGLILSLSGVLYGQSLPLGGIPAGFPVYTDSFNRANGALGSNWTTPSGAGSLQILGNIVYASSAPVLHALEKYSAGTFQNNQWTQFTVTSGIGSATPGSSGQGAMVRANGTDWYNDAVATGASLGGLSLYRIGNAASVDFCGAAPIANYAVADVHKLAVAGTGPVWFWAFKNGVINAACTDTVDNINGGQPGLGTDDQNSSPQLSVGAWSGGSLPSFSTTATDNFTRPNDGWLGVNWGFIPTCIRSGSGSAGSYMTLSGNGAINQVSSSMSVAVWTTPFSSTQGPITTIGALGSGDWVASVARLTPSSSCTESYYFALITGGNVVDIFVQDSGGQTLLSSVGTFSGTPTSIELDASGTSPVVLTVKINGSTFGSSYSDSSHLLTGTYEGFALFGTTTTRVTGWAGH